MLSPRAGRRPSSSPRHLAFIFIRTSCLFSFFSAPSFTRPSDPNSALFPFAVTVERSPASPLIGAPKAARRRGAGINRLICVLLRVLFTFASAGVGHARCSCRVNHLSVPPSPTLSGKREKQTAARNSRSCVCLSFRAGFFLFPTLVLFSSVFAERLDRWKCQRPASDKAGLVSPVVRAHARSTVSRPLPAGRGRRPISR